MQNSFKTENPKYDLHLAAHKISPATITTLLELGFTRDEFANSRYCDSTEFHGTFLSWRAAPETYAAIIEFLEEDDLFNGGLEEEITLPQYRKIYGTTEYNGATNSKEAFAKNLKKELFAAIGSLKRIPCPIGTHKACDLHLNVHSQSVYVLGVLDSLELVSFDKPDKDSGDEFHRIYTWTFEDLKTGIETFKTIDRLLEEYANGRILFKSKLKMEILTKIYRKPLDGILLPIIPKYPYSGDV